MTNSRRDFIKKMALAAGGTGIANTLPFPFEVIERAMAINPEPGTTFEDAEHVVLLMQENRSFDHVFGSLQGVRGFNDPRAIRLPDSNLAWLQTNKKKDTYLPYRLDIKDSKVTWMGGLPHSWTDQVDARNNGKYNQWLIAKHRNDMPPFALGYYTRNDLPFYYALADAFTVSDHHFCSSLTGTTPNRLYYWSGTIREEQNGQSPANVNNGFVYYGNQVHWKTFPEILEENDIDWKIYQNEISVGVGFKGEQDPWLSNFTDNPIEWFSQYNVRFHPAHVSYMKKRLADLEEELKDFKGSDKERTKRERLVRRLRKNVKTYSAENFQKLSPQAQNIHQKAFTTNHNDPDYHKLRELAYNDHGTQRKLQVPKGDPLFQFRKDVESGNLPTVSWLVGAQRFSDHPSSPWFGSWYTSEILHILTQNPEVWKKTIFILCYDENDGYFDHLPPFTAANPEDKHTGFCSDGIDTTSEFVTKTQADALKGKFKDPERVSPIGLGYRIPFVVASPWSRGGKVNSQLSDNTSILQFLEKFLSKKTGKHIYTDNLSQWRRTVCSDLTSVFTPYQGETIKLPEFIAQTPFVERIYNAKFKRAPKKFKPVSAAEKEQVNQGLHTADFMQDQEKGIRPADALPYELYATGNLTDDHTFSISLKSGNNFFSNKAAGVAFYVYNQLPYHVRNYAVKAGDELTDNWKLVDGKYHLKAYGPNGFYREFKGQNTDTPLSVSCRYEVDTTKCPTGNIILDLKGHGRVEVIDNAYGQKTIKKRLNRSVESETIQLNKQHNWYDLTLRYKDNPNQFIRLAGHVETGKSSFTDPFMGGIM